MMHNILLFAENALSGLVLLKMPLEHTTTSLSAKNVLTES